MSYGGQIIIPGHGDLEATSEGGPYINAVADDYFSTLGTRVLRGRTLTSEDGVRAERVGVVNETTAKLAWPGEDPLGRCFKLGDETAPCFTVVGVVEDARRQALDEGPTPQVYFPLSQAPPWVASRALFVRGRDVDPLRGSLRSAVQSLERGVPFVEVRGLGELLDPQLRAWRTGTVVFSLFGLLALAVATLGIFAAVGHAVASRTAELGVRKALGARFRDLLWTVMKSGLFPAAAGLTICFAAAVALGGFIAPLLFRISARDPGVIATAALALLGAALLASFLPALRVQAVDPAVVLRVE
jgi:putative ABC transport system permease protein